MPLPVAHCVPVTVRLGVTVTVRLGVNCFILVVALGNFSLRLRQLASVELAALSGLMDGKKYGVSDYTY